METATNPVAFLRSLKGAPLSVLIAIRIFPGPATLLQLATATGYDQHTCARAADALEAMGYLQRAHYRGWRLTSSAQQLPLWTPGELVEIEPEPPGLPAGAPQPAEPKRAFLAFQPAEAADAPAAASPDELKRAILAFQPPDESVDELKRAILAVQGPDTSPDELAPAHPEPPPEPAAAAEPLKRANLAFQPAEAPAEPPADGAPGELKRAFLAFQPADEPPDDLKRANLAFQPAALARSGGGGLINLTTRGEDDLKPPPPPTGAREPKREPPRGAQAQFGPDEQDLLAALIDLTGCPRHRAEEAVAAARTAGQHTPWLHLQVLRWHAYLVDGRGKNLNNPGYFVAKKLEDGEACPSEDVRNGHALKAQDLKHALRAAQRAAGETPMADARAGYDAPPEYAGIIQH